MGRPMQKNVEAALGLITRKGPPTLHLGYCHCGGERKIGTDQDCPSLRSKGMAFGRMVEYCPECLMPSQIYHGPVMLTRLELYGPDAPRFWSSPDRIAPRRGSTMVPRPGQGLAGHPPTSTDPTS